MTTQKDKDEPKKITFFLKVVNNGDSFTIDMLPKEPQRTVREEIKKKIEETGMVVRHQVLDCCYI